MRSSRGFTLIEVLVALSIVAVIGVMAFEGQMPVAMLIAQSLIGAKGFGR